MFYHCQAGEVLNLWQIVRAQDTRDDSLLLEFSNGQARKLTGRDARAVAVILYTHSIHAPRQEAPIVTAPAGGISPA